jgi:hypothetical protein
MTTPPAEAVPCRRPIRSARTVTDVISSWWHPAMAAMTLF